MPATNLGPLCPAQVWALCLQVYVHATVALHSGMHVPHGAGDQECLAPLPPFDPTSVSGHHNSAMCTTTACQGLVFHKACQPPWQLQHLTRMLVLCKALKKLHMAPWAWFMCILDAKASPQCACYWHSSPWHAESMSMESTSKPLLSWGQS